MSVDAKRLALAAIVAGSPAFGTSAAKAQSAFYRAADAEIAGRPGTIIRRESMWGAAAGASAYRLLYGEGDGIPGLTVLAGLRSRQRATPFILVTDQESVRQRARPLGAAVVEHLDVQAIRAAVRRAAAIRPAND